MELDQELKTYREHLETWMRDHAGKFAVIKDDRVIGIYVDYEDALSVGYERCGLVPFLVKKIESPETVLYFTRELGPCRT